MGEHRHDVTEAELAVLQALWDLGPATIRQLVERVYQQTKKPTGGLYETEVSLDPSVRLRGAIADGRNGIAVRGAGN